MNLFEKGGPDTTCVPRTPHRVNRGLLTLIFYCVVVVFTRCKTSVEAIASLFHSRVVTTIFSLLRLACARIKSLFINWVLSLVVEYESHFQAKRYSF